MPEVNLTHPFKDRCPSIDEWLLNEDGKPVNTINAFCGRTNDLAKKYGHLFHHDPEVGASKIKGDALELLVEFMIKSDGTDNRIGIYDYKPITDMDDDDVGVDGFGIGEDGNPATVQVKFRRGDYILNANDDHLSNFLTASQNDFQVPVDCLKNMLLVTTGLKVAESTMDKMLKNKVRVLHRDALRHMYDVRPEWWTRFYERVVACRTKRNVIPIRTLRPHQIEAVNAAMADENGKGKILLPTGTGKTTIAAEIVRKTVVDCTDKDITPVIKVNASRILLCFQLFEEICKHLISCGIDAKYVNYNSGNADDKYCGTMMRRQGGIFRSIESTTSVKDMKAIYEKSQKDRIPLIVVSTYNSSVKFASSGIVPDLTIHDEAHNLVSPEFREAAVLPSKRNFFFTATEKTTDSDEGAGMNNPDIFDNVIYTRSAKQMIDMGEQLPPWVHVVKARSFIGVDVDKLDTDYDTLFNSVAQAYFAHEKQIRADSYDPSKLGAKVLVVCRGQQDLIEMFKTPSFVRFRTMYPDIHIYGLSSNYGLYNDGVHSREPVTHMKKYGFLKSVQALKAHERCIIFHVDMIGEGIDVPGLTGVMPFRNCDVIKFIQNIGRSTRLHPDDRRRFYAKEINVTDRTKYIKPCSWVIIPAFMLDSVGFEARFRGIVENLRNVFDFQPRLNVLIDNVHGLSDDEEIDTVNELLKQKRHTKSGLEEFDHVFDSRTMVERILFDDTVDVKTKAVLDEYYKLLGVVQKDTIVEVKPVVEVKQAPQETIVLPPKAIIPPSESESSTDKGKFGGMTKVETSPIFTMSCGKVEAKGQVKSGKFVVLAGSKASPDTVPSANGTILSKREELVKDGYVDGNWLVIKDIEFKTASGAGSALYGGGMNGKTAWKNGDETFGEWLDKAVV